MAQGGWKVNRFDVAVVAFFAGVMVGYFLASREIPIHRPQTINVECPEK